MELASEFRDNETGMHVLRMSFLSRLIAQKIGLDKSETNIIFNAAPMHDVGKIGIPDSILQKPGRLSSDEILIMQKHSELGANIIGEHEDRILRSAKTAALTHHEKWDGSGYSRGLSGEHIPLIGRILAIVDFFNALTCIRPDKEAWPIERAIDLMEKETGKPFDPHLLPVFIENIDDVKEIMKRNSDKAIDNSSSEMNIGDF